MSVAIYGTHVGSNGSILKGCVLNCFGVMNVFDLMEMDSMKDFMSRMLGSDVARAFGRLRHGAC